MATENEFPPNSRLARNERPEDEKPPVEDRPYERRAEPVTVRPISRKKPSLGKRFVRTFFSGDVNNLGEYLLKDVIVPMIKDLVFNSIEDALKRSMYSDGRPGGSYRGGSSTRYDNRTRVSYDQQYRTVPGGRPTAATSSMRRPPARQPDATDVDGIVLDTYAEAEAVISGLGDIMDHYGSASVADLNDLTMQSSVHTDYNFGWENMQGMKVERYDGRFVLVLPRPYDLRTNR